ncbi:MAG: hypothetical protein JST64_08650, partial [Actinobacteria bacterium]|nr:hypothetical protein [Actinomycetota bacterium]
MVRRPARPGRSLAPLEAAAHGAHGLRASDGGVLRAQGARRPPSQRVGPRRRALHGTRSCAGAPDAAALRRLAVDPAPRPAARRRDRAVPSAPGAVRVGAAAVIWAGAALRVWPGTPAPLGASWDGAGTNFAVFSGSAANEGGSPGERGGVTLCLFDAEGVEIPVPLPERSGSVWHGYLPDVGPGVR